MIYDLGTSSLIAVVLFWSALNRGMWGETKHPERHTCAHKRALKQRRTQKCQVVDRAHLTMIYVPFTSGIATIGHEHGSACVVRWVLQSCVRVRRLANMRGTTHLADLARTQRGHLVITCYFLEQAQTPRAVIASLRSSINAFAMADKNKQKIATRADRKQMPDGHLPVVTGNHMNYEQAAYQCVRF